MEWREFVIWQFEKRWEDDSGEEEDGPGGGIGERRWRSELGDGLDQIYEDGYEAEVEDEVFLVSKTRRTVHHNDKNRSVLFSTFPPF